jgi:hypothetical protein
MIEMLLRVAVRSLAKPDLIVEPKVRKGGKAR